MIKEKSRLIHRLLLITITLIITIQTSNFKFVKCEPPNQTAQSIIMSDMLKPSYSDNKCILNPPIRFGNSTFYKGYLMKRNSLLDGNSTSFNLQKKYNSLTATIGIATIKPGQCTVKIFGDSVPLFAQSFTEKSLPKNITLNVNNVSNLVIKLECDPFGPWVGIVNPRLILSTSSSK